MPKLTLIKYTLKYQKRYKNVYQIFGKKKFPTHIFWEAAQFHKSNPKILIYITQENYQSHQSFAFVVDYLTQRQLLIEGFKNWKHLS